MIPELTSEVTGFTLDARRSWLVMNLESSGRVIKHQLDILLNRKPEWLLPGALRPADDHDQLILDICGQTSLVSVLSTEILTPGQKQQVFQALIDTLLEAGDWLLDPSLFVLDARYVFINRRSDEDYSLRLAYWPVSQSDPSYNFVLSITRLMEMLDYPAEQIEQLDQLEGQPPEQVLLSVSRFCQNHQDPDTFSPLRNQNSGDRQSDVKTRCLNKVASGLSQIRQKVTVFIEQLFTDPDDPDIDDEDSCTQIIAADPDSFRMALLSEGKPGTPDENTGVRAYILVDDFLIGRDEKSCDLVLASPGIGRQHARICRRGGSFFIGDLGSPNGTRVDGRRINKDADVLLGDNCQIQFADQIFFFTAD